MNPTTIRNLVAAAILAAVALCLAAIYYSGARLGESMQGPSKVARAPDGTIWVASHGALHRFTEKGERKEVIALSALGRGPVVSELLPLSDGTLVIAEAVPSGAWRCDVKARKCASITSRIAGQAGPTAHALMIAADEERRRYYISDNANHRLILIDFEGKVLDVTRPERVMYPNELTVDRPGELVVVDTTHRRLVRIGVERDTFGADLWQMKTDTSLTRLGRRVPMDLARSPDGGWWVLIARDGMKEGDVVLFGGDSNALKRIDLGPDSDPTRIALVPDGLLVAEPIRAMLTRIAPDGAVAGPWGDAAFQAELDGLRATRVQWRSLRLAAQVLLVALPLAGVFVLWRLGERVPVRPSLAVPASPAPVERGIRWLEVTPEFRRRARMILTVLIGAMWILGIATVLVVWYLGLLAQLRAGLILFAAVLVLIMLVPLTLLLRIPKAWRVRLGTDGQSFFLDPGNGEVEKYSFSELATSNGRQLLAGRRLIALRLGPGPLFAEGDVRDYIIARIPASGRLDPLSLSMRALGRGSRELWAILIVLALAAAANLLPGLFPGMLAYFKNVLMQLLSG